MFGRKRKLEIRREKPSSKRRFALGSIAGAASAFFFDPQSGRRRRNVARDRALGFLRRLTGRAESAGRSVAAEAESAGRTVATEAKSAGRSVAAEASDVSQKMQHRQEEPKTYDDVTLAQKVQSEIFREADVPKGKVDVNAAEGVVELRGEVDSQELIDDLVSKTRNVQGVREVENLLRVGSA